MKTNLEIVIFKLSFFRVDHYAEKCALNIFFHVKLDLSIFFCQDVFPGTTNSMDGCKHTKYLSCDKCDMVHYLNVILFIIRITTY